MWCCDASPAALLSHVLAGRGDDDIEPRRPRQRAPRLLPEDATLTEMGADGRPGSSCARRTSSSSFRRPERAAHGPQARLSDRATGRWTSRRDGGRMPPDRRSLLLARRRRRRLGSTARGTAIDPHRHSVLRHAHEPDTDGGPVTSASDAPPARTRPAREFEQRDAAARIECQWALPSLISPDSVTRCLRQRRMLRACSAARCTARAALLLGAAARRGQAACAGNSELPINCEAASTDFDYKNNSLVFKRVEITQGDMQVTAQQASATGLNFDNSEWQLTGDVRIVVPDGKLAVERSARHVPQQRDRECHRSWARRPRSSRNCGRDQVARGRAGTITTMSRRAPCA